MAIFSSIVYCLWVRTEAYPSAEHMKSALPEQALALSSNIRLGWKSLPGKNTVAYYENSSIADVKSFKTLVKGVKVTNFFTSSLTTRQNKLELHKSAKSCQVQILKLGLVTSDKEKSFKTLGSGFNVLKLFLFVFLTVEINQSQVILILKVLPCSNALIWPHHQ